MTPPCGHEQPRDGCPSCLLALSDPVFRRAWGVKSDAASVLPRSLPCAYLGDVINRMGCNCPGRWKRKCALHGEVTINGSCKSCPDYDPT